MLTGNSVNRGEPLLLSIMLNYIKIAEVARAYPDTIFSIKAEDLEQFGRQLGGLVRIEYERQKTEDGHRQNDELLLPEDVTTMLRISSSTLNRLAKAHILTPVWVGGQKRYWLSDVNSYLNKEV